MKKAMLLLLAVTMLSCSTYTLYDREVVGVVTEVFVRPNAPFEYEVLITSYNGDHYKLMTDTRYEIGDQVYMPTAIRYKRNR